MSLTNSSTKSIVVSGWIENNLGQSKAQIQQAFNWKKVDLLEPMRNWLNGLTINTPQLARRICHLIPAQCPFARNVKFFGRTVFSIPPLCKINPVYEELMMLRFRALCYLADECGEDISAYC